MKVAVRSSNRAMSNIAFANAKKEEGNRLFQKNRYKDAESAYCVALTYLLNETSTEGRSTMVIVHSNIAACLMKFNDHQGSIMECSKALQLDPDHCKSLFRRGLSYSRLAQYSHAKTDLQRACELNTTDEKCKSEYESCCRRHEENRQKSIKHAKSVMQDPVRQPKMSFTKVQILPVSRAIDFAKQHLLKI